MKIEVANESHIKYAQIISDTITESAKVRGTGIAQRSPEYIIQRLQNGNAIIALEGDVFAGFCYIEVWGNKNFVANSGLIVHPDFRNQGLAKKIKKAIFELSKQKFPNAKIFGITTGLAVMKMNYEIKRNEAEPFPKEKNQIAVNSSAVENNTFRLRSM